MKRIIAVAVAVAVAVVVGAAPEAFATQRSQIKLGGYSASVGPKSAPTTSIGFSVFTNNGSTVVTSWGFSSASCPISPNLRPRDMRITADGAFSFRKSVEADPSFGTPAATMTIHGRFVKSTVATGTVTVTHCPKVSFTAKWHPTTTTAES